MLARLGGADRPLPMPGVVGGDVDQIDALVLDDGPVRTRARNAELCAELLGTLGVAAADGDELATFAFGQALATILAILPVPSTPHRTMSATGLNAAQSSERRGSHRDRRT